MKNTNPLRIALVVVALLILVHYLWLAHYLPDLVNTIIEIILPLIEVVLIYAFTKMNRRK